MNKIIDSKLSTLGMVFGGLSVLSYVAAGVAAIVYYSYCEKMDFSNIGGWDTWNNNVRYSFVSSMVLLGIATVIGIVALVCYFTYLGAKSWLKRYAENNNATAFLNRTSLVSDGDIRDGSASFAMRIRI